MNVLKRALLVCLVFACQNLAAIEIDRLYEAEVIAKSELEKDKNAAIRQALIVVLTRVLAGNDILQDETVKAVLADTRPYVSEFQYALMANNTKDTDRARLIRVKFDEKLLVDTLRPGKLSFWNEIRSRTLVWLVVEEHGKQRFFDAAKMPEIDAAVDKASKQKRLPILYPIQDLKEKRQLSIGDILSAYSEQLLEVSSRYDVVSTLAGKLLKKDNCWKAEWTLYFDGKIDQWRSPCAAINKATLNGFQGVYDRLSKYYAVKSDTKEISSVILKVSNISSIANLAKVTDYLNSLSMVRTVTWIGKEKEYNIYRVFYQGYRQLLNNSIATQRVLKSEDFSGQKGSEEKYKFSSKI
jgi:hypothetical protein